MITLLADAPVVTDTTWTVNTILLLVIVIELALIVIWHIVHR